MSKLLELQKLYRNDKFTTGDIKSEAWKIKGISGDYFRNMVSGIKTNDKPFPESEIEDCLNALIKAHKRDLVKRINFSKSLLKK